MNLKLTERNLSWSQGGKIPTFTGGTEKYH